jgi:thiamine kinase-like enzyme
VNPDPRLDHIRAALHATGHPAAAADLVPLRVKGLAHDHVRLDGTGLLARIPKQSQLDLPAAKALSYEAACFDRAAASGATPLLRGVIAPAPALPWGALLVDEIEGRAARLPEDLPAMARALAALHALPLPSAAQRAPLKNPADGLAALLGELEKQAQQAAMDSLSPSAARAIRDGLRHLHEHCAQAPRPEHRLISFDAHPGNFVIDTTGRAWLVDLEKCRYGAPGLDLAHATLYTSTTWDIDASAPLSLREVAGFYEAWSQRIDAATAAVARPWHAPLRHAMWLWSLTWCARWHAQYDARAVDENALHAHVRERVRHYLSTESVQRVEHELRALRTLWVHA